MTEHHPLFLRAHTAKHNEQLRRKCTRTQVSVPKWAERVLIFDTEICILTLARNSRYGRHDAEAFTGS